MDTEVKSDWATNVASTVYVWDTASSSPPPRKSWDIAIQFFAALGAMWSGLHLLRHAWESGR